MANEVKLNVGCGTDIRDGFINIDGSDRLQNIDKIIDMDKETLLNHFDENSISYILAYDILEHRFHWEAVQLLKDFYQLLKIGGRIELRLPDCEYIIKDSFISIPRKLNLMFGGQDIPQGNNEQDESRKKFPQFFCHKYGWTRKTLTESLNDIGFHIIEISKGKRFGITKKVDTNMHILAEK